MANKRSALNGQPGIYNLTSHIIEELGIAIVSGLYGDHNPLPNEGALSSQFGTSRSTVREAIRALAAKNLVGARPRHGTWVEPEEYWNWLDPDVLRWLRGRELPAALLRELIEFRLAIEPIAAALAATTASEYSKDRIRKAYLRLEAVEIGIDTPVEAETAFHLAIAQASNNRFFSQFGGAAEAALRISVRLLNSPQRTRKINLEANRRIVEAIDANDPAAAEREMRAMIKKILERIGYTRLEDAPRGRVAGNNL